MNMRRWAAIAFTVFSAGGIVLAFLHSKLWGAAALLTLASLFSGAIACARDDLAEDGDTLPGVITPRENRIFGWASVAAVIGAASLIWLSVQSQAP